MVIRASTSSQRFAHLHSYESHLIDGQRHVLDVDPLGGEMEVIVLCYYCLKWRHVTAAIQVIPEKWCIVSCNEILG